MFYPKNFPKQFEQPLIELLLLLERDFKKKIPTDEKKFNRLVLDKLRMSEVQKYFKDIKPSNWWFTFILLRHENKFSPMFIEHVQPFLTKTKTRSTSGIVALSLFTKGVGCSFSCVYCPNEPGVPKSYFSDEPAVMRAIRHNFDPYKQTLQRLIMFTLSNHPIDKVEIIIKGGTFSFYPKAYRRWFVKRIFDACNVDVITYLKLGKLVNNSSKTLPLAQTKNETAKSRIIGMNIETRPDYINEKEIKFLRTLGVTHVEIGIQILDDEVYKLINRGHKIKDVIDATLLLKNAGFKVGYHLMPNLPGS
ncbi:MAG: radical SAM protein, partial [Patescibacteria group bacterium]